MTLPQALLAFAVAAGLLTVLPGPDTMMVLRTSAREGRRAGLLAVAGIGLGCLGWGAAVAVGLGALLQASALAYATLTSAGAAYLVWFGLGMILRPRRALADTATGPVAARETGAVWLRRGLLTNLLNPKIGVFYVSFLPQFVPAGHAPAPIVFVLAAAHVAIGSAWLALLATGAARLASWFARPGRVALLDRVTGAVFVAFGLRLALARGR